MTASQIGKWTVVVVVEEEVSMTASYQMSPNTRLSELMKIWRDDFEVFGNWIFVSANEEITFHDDSITLKKIGETAPRIVTLRAELIDEPINEIFVYLKDKFHHLSVKPHDKLYNVLWRLPEKSNYLEYNGLPLNATHTLQQIGLKNKSVVYESYCSVAVKISSGTVQFFQMSPDSMVLQLKEKVKVYETNDFSLTYQGRHLKSDETVRKLTQVVEVTTAKFVVNVQDQRVSWITKKEPIAVSEFLCQLVAKLNIDAQMLDRMEFVCIGCQRRICQSKKYVQKLPVECCAEMSLTLNAVSPSDSGTTSEENDITKQIQTLHKYLVQHRSKDARTANSRCVCREIKDKLTEEGLDYNIVTRCSDSLLKQITALEDKIKELNDALENLKTEKSDLETEVELLKATNVKSMEEIEISKKETNRVVEENRKLKNERYSEIEILKKENMTMVEENRNLKIKHNSEIEILKKENLRMVEENWELKNEHNSEIEILKKENMTMVDENRKLIKENESLQEEQKSIPITTNPRGAIGPGPSRFPKASDVEPGVKLLVAYYPGAFSPASCPVVTSQGEWPFAPHWSYFKCKVRGIRPGSTPFDEVVAVLQPLFIRGKISGIRQCLGSVAGRTVTRATSRDGDKALRYDKSPYCGVDGAEHSWQEAGKPGLQNIRRRGSVFVCGGGQRTVIEILW